MTFEQLAPVLQLLQLLLVPMFGMLWSIHSRVSELKATVQAHGVRLATLERITLKG